jgi:hypothetical protein
MITEGPVAEASSARTSGHAHKDRRSAEMTADERESVCTCLPLAEQTPFFQYGKLLSRLARSFQIEVKKPQVCGARIAPQSFDGSSNRSAFLL